jgi:hypothetical protein
LQNLNLVTSLHYTICKASVLLVGRFSFDHVEVYLDHNGHSHLKTVILFSTKILLHILLKLC